MSGNTSDDSYNNRDNSNYQCNNASLVPAGIINFGMIPGLWDLGHIPSEFDRLFVQSSERMILSTSTPSLHLST